MQVWKYISYDVWGNETDGYEVNQSFTTSLWIELPEDATKSTLRDAIICQLSWNIPNAEQFETDWLEETIYITYAGKPEGEFRLASETEKKQCLNE